MDQLEPELQIEDAKADDLLDGLSTLKGNSGWSIVAFPAPGLGPDRQLEWALSAITQAQTSKTPETRVKECVDAIMHARRALACLLDWYLDRDLATHCRDKPGSPKLKVKFLITRKIIDELTSRVLERAIKKRNEVEHAFVEPSLEQAEDVVELVRRTMAALRMRSPPETAPWVFGAFIGGIRAGKHGREGMFGGWKEPLAVFSRFKPTPWVGLLLPETRNRALVRRAFLKDVYADQLAALLNLVEDRFGKVDGGCDSESIQSIARKLRLLEV